MKIISGMVSTVDTDEMTIEELEELIQNLKSVKARKLEIRSLYNRFNELLEEAHTAGLAVYGMEDCVNGELCEILVE